MVPLSLFVNIRESVCKVIMLTKSGVTANISMNKTVSLVK